MNVAELLLEQAAARPDAPALIERRRAVSFAELDDLGARAAGLLLKAGLRPGDAALVLQPMSIDLYVALLALFRLGLVVMVLDPAAGLGHVARCCELRPPRALLASSKAHLLRLVSPALRRIPIHLAIGWPVPFATRWAALHRTRPHREVAAVDADTPALLTFTSGSTGEPRGVVRTHGFLRAQHAAFAGALGLEPGGLDVATLPIVLLANLASGVASLIPDCDLRRPGSIAAGPVVRQIAERGATSSVASPAFFECLARHCAGRGATLPSLRKLFTGGAPVFPRLLGQMRALAPHAEVVALYGSTEAEPIARLPSGELRPEDEAATQAGAGLLAGRPVPEVAVRILPDSWGEPLGPYSPAEFEALGRGVGEPGEIVVAGPHVLTGYLGGRGDAEAKIRVGDGVWHRTGDAGYLDAAGRLWLLGRCAGRLDDEHGRLYPFAAEAAAYADPRVKRAALVAHRNRRLLLVEAHDPAAPPDAGALCRQLAWAHVAEVRLWRRIPVDGRHNAKIDYPALHRELDRAGSRADF